MLSQFIDRLQKEQNIDGLLTDNEDGTWSFFIDEYSQALVKEEGDYFEFTTSIGKAPEKVHDLEALLAANLAARGTMGAVLGLNKTASEVILWHQLPKHVDFEWFQGELEEFLTYAQDWGQFVRGEESQEM